MATGGTFTGPATSAHAPIPGQVFLLPQIVPGLAVLREHFIEPPDEVVIHAPILTEVTLEAWIGPEDTTLPPEVPEPTIPAGAMLSEGDGEPLLFEDGEIWIEE